MMPDEIYQLQMALVTYIRESARGIASARSKQKEPGCGSTHKNHRDWNGWNWDADLEDFSWLDELL